jgi:hypothetical protein
MGSAWSWGRQRAGLVGWMIHDAAGNGRIADHDAAGIVRSMIHDGAGIVRWMIHDAAGIVRSMIHDAPGGLKPTPAMPGMGRLWSVAALVASSGW